MRLRDINIGTEQKPEHIFDNSTMDLDPDLELYPPQEEAVKAGLLDSNQNFLIASPTASGKTLLAELVMVSSIVRDSGKCLYLVPLNALAYEKYLNFRDKYDYSNSAGAGAGAIAKVGISTGDYESSSRYLERYDIIILTLEKLDSLTRLKPAWLRTVSVVVVDEVHVIGDDKRGPRLEGAMARFMSFNPAARIIALSATVANV
ncbi:MAG: DEAD/DEAH box helicase, partial [Methanophagales archaeon]|nr:DEAD/DEAH box helicase [Methanophagales archaeon]